MKIFNLGYSTPWLITTLIYIMFIAYQVLSRTNEYLEKGKVREIIYNIMDAVNGIPLINKDDKIIILWDVIFKKLIDKKSYFLYDNIIKIKTKTIDRYVNQYPSLLLNSSMDMIERGNIKIDTKSLIRGKDNKGKNEDKELDISEEMKNILFVKYLSNDKITFANFDSSIYIDIIMNNEYEPPEYEKFGIIPDSRYDGFSLIAYYKNHKYAIVPRTMVFGKRIDKEKWLYRNIDRMLQCAENIAAGIQDYEIIVDELSLKGVLTDYIDDEQSRIPVFHFECIEENHLIFTGLEQGKELAKAYCVLETTPNGFEIKLVKYELIIDGVGEVVDEEKTIAIGTAYQPLITIMEKMPLISNNVRLAISKEDIEDLVIK
ncbi:MAG: hypothetical protein PHS15_03815 [Clostridiaceae bacterium]|nr:hypothetical protein [Clostridiaceae bacterium]